MCWALGGHLLQPVVEKGRAFLGRQQVCAWGRLPGLETWVGRGATEIQRRRKPACGGPAPSPLPSAWKDRVLSEPGVRARSSSQPGDP